MSNEELMKPRYKVIERWPDMGDNKYFVGEIITLDLQDKEFYSAKRGRSYLFEAYFNGHPLLFKRLHWSDERKVEDMPEYVKDGDEVYRVKEWDGTQYPYVFIDWGHGSTLLYGDVHPATLQEYEAFINRK